MQDSSLERSINSGVKWNLSLSLLGQLFNVAITLCLSRLLLPQDYGLLAIALAFTSIIDTLPGVGSAAAITQRPSLTDEYYTGVFIIVGSLGAAMAAVVWLVAPLIASAYLHPEITSIMHWLALTIPLHLLQSVPLAILQRQLQFNRIAVITFGGMMVSGLLALYLAYEGYAWRALVAKSFSFLMIQTVCYCYLGWPRFRWKPSWKEMKEFLRFGVPQSLTQFFLQMGRRVDDILIGKWMGSAALGIYSMAYSLYLWPIANIKGRIGQVVFAGLTKVQHDPQAISYYYLRFISLTTFIAYPVVVGFLVVSDLAVVGFMGEKWLEAIPILRMLCLASLFEVCIFPGAVYQATGRTDLFLRHTILTRTLTIAGILVTVALPYGLLGVATSIVITSFFNFLIFNYYVGKLIPITNREVIRVMTRGGTYSLIMLITVTGARAIATDSLSNLQELSVSILTGILTYSLLIYRFHPEVYDKARAQVKKYYPLPSS